MARFIRTRDHCLVNIDHIVCVLLPYEGRGPMIQTIDGQQYRIDEATIARLPQWAGADKNKKEAYER